MARGVSLTCITVILLSSCAPALAPTAGAPEAAPQATATPVVAHTPVATIIPASASGCPVTPLVTDSAPRDRNAAPVLNSFWYINADRILWVETMLGGWYAGDAMKTYWVRPQGTQLVITGHRLDAEAPPLHAGIPCCYRTGFQIVGLIFPTEGCWEVSAKAGDSELRFVTEVKPASRSAAGGSCNTLVDAVKLSDAIVVGWVNHTEVSGRYAWHSVSVVETWKLPPDRARIGNWFSLLQDLLSETRLEKDRQYVLFIQYAPWRLVCAQRSVIDTTGDQAIALGNNSLWSVGTITDWRKVLDQLMTTR